ncbi:MAG: hypothetical protein AAFX46_14510, partial [Cyanobacteria bacterium J06636_27]
NKKYNKNYNTNLLLRQHKRKNQYILIEPKYFPLLNKNKHIINLKNPYIKTGECMVNFSNPLSAISALHNAFALSKARASRRISQ